MYRFSLKDELIYIITKTHEMLGFSDTKDARILMLDSAAVETHLGRDFRQHGYSMQSNKGAFSPWQIELKTSYDIWDKYIIKKPALYHKMCNIRGKLSDKDALIGNLYYACAIARLQYSRHKEPLPSATDVKARFKYYKKYFNSYRGDTSEQEFIACHDAYVA